MMLVSPLWCQCLLYDTNVSKMVSMSSVWCQYLLHGASVSTMMLLFLLWCQFHHCHPSTCDQDHHNCRSDGDPSTSSWKMHRQVQLYSDQTYHRVQHMLQKAVGIK